MILRGAIPHMQVDPACLAQMMGVKVCGRVASIIVFDSGYQK